jgi:catechol 2,3-dioxygenase-like lactoylglutathione lyase family enzyme
MKTLFPLTVTTDVRAAEQFYVDLFGMEVLADVGWYVQLYHRDNPSMQIAFIEDGHDSVPPSHRGHPRGVVMTLEFDGVDELHQRAIGMGLPIHVTLRDEPWGQRHFITEDPTGLLVDVVQPIDPSAEFLAELAAENRG